MKEIRFATVGTGWIVDYFLEGAAMVEGFVHTAVYSRTEEKGRAFAKKHGVEKVYTSLEALAADPEVDAVYIASPNVCHSPQAALFLQAGKHVLCEKPMAATKQEVADLYALAHQNDCALLEAMTSLYPPQRRILEDALTRIGPIRQVRFGYCQFSSKYAAFRRGELPNIFNPAMQTGSLMDIGVYCVYPALFLFGRWETVTAHAVRHENGIDLCGTACLTYPERIVTLSYSKVGDGFAPSELIGEEGTVTIDRLSRLDGIRLCTREKTELLYQSCPADHPMKFEAEAFRDACLHPENRDPEWEQLALCAAETMAEIRRQCGMSF